MGDIKPPFVSENGKEVAKTVEFEDTVFQTYTWYTTTPDKYKGRIIMVHGYRDFYPTYFRFIDFMINNGYDFFYFDQRGEGKTLLKNGDKGYSYDEFVYKSLTFMINYNIDEMRKEKKDPSKLNLFGFSMGGGIILNYLCHGELKDKINSYVGGAPLILLHPNTYPGVVIEWVVRTCCFLLPFTKKLKVKTELKLENMTRDKVYGDYLENVNKSENLSGHFVECRDFILRGRKLLSPSLFNQVDIEKPLLIVHGNDDGVNDFKGSDLFIKSLNERPGMKNKRLVDINDGKHCLLLDVEEVYKNTQEEILKFFDEFN